MLFAGVEPVSLVDYPGEISTVLFTQGCNLQCEYCQNQELIPLGLPKEGVSDYQALSIIRRNYPKIKHIVITGGEPGVHKKALAGFLYDLKREFPNINVKIDSNGMIPNFIQDLSVSANFIALDYKGPAFPYYKDNFSIWQNSLKWLVLFPQSEVRLTVYPKYFPNETKNWEAIARLLENRTVVIQQYRQTEKTPRVFPYMEDILRSAGAIIGRSAKTVSYRI